jgi:hypothetical protein
MKEIDSHIPVERSSEKSFGIVFSIVFLIIALYPLNDAKELNLWALIISTIFLLLAFVSPKILSFPNKLWFRFGLLLGSIVAPLIMAIVYFVVILPIGLIMRLLGKDLLKNQLDKDAHSYWIERDDPVGTMKNQF